MVAGSSAPAVETFVTAGTVSESSHVRHGLTRSFQSLRTDMNDVDRQSVGASRDTDCTKRADTKQPEHRAKDT